MARATSNDLRLSYDQENDIVYIAVGKARQAVCETLDNGVVIKRDPTTRRIIGLILLDVTRNFASSHPRPVVPGLRAALQLQPA